MFSSLHQLVLSVAVKSPFALIVHLYVLHSTAQHELIQASGKASFDNNWPQLTSLIVTSVLTSAMHFCKFTCWQQCRKTLVTAGSFHFQLRQELFPHLCLAMSVLGCSIWVFTQRKRCLSASIKVFRLDKMGFLSVCHVFRLDCTFTSASSSCYIASQHYIITLHCIASIKISQLRSLHLHTSASSSLAATLQGLTVKVKVSL